MARPKGVKQKKNDSKYVLPEGVTLKHTDEYYTKETKLTFIDAEFGEFISTFKLLIDAGYSLHPEQKKRRKSLNNPGATPEAKAKREQTMLQKYGVKNALENPKFLEKARETLKSNFGVDHPMKSEELKAKQRQSTLESTGYANPLFSPEIQAQIKKTNLAKYGFENASKSPIVQEKILNSFDIAGYEGKVSKEELEVRSFIKSLGFTVRSKTVGGANPFKLDMYIDSEKIAIEYNGCYWHRHDLKKDYMYHRKKTDICAQKGIRLIHIFDFHWKNQPEKVKAVLRSILNKNEQRVAARDCEFVEIDYKTSCDFLNKHHLRGDDKSSRAFALKTSSGEIVSVVTFKRHHRGTGDLLLSRFCVKGGLTVQGGLSKLVKNARKLLGESFYTFIDMTYATKDNWIATGWEEITTLKPDYFYYSTNGSRYISKQSMSGKEENIPNGIYKVFDCGKIKLKYK